MKRLNKIIGIVLLILGMAFLLSAAHHADLTAPRLMWLAISGLTFFASSAFLFEREEEGA